MCRWPAGSWDGPWCFVAATSVWWMSLLSRLAAVDRRVLGDLPSNQSPTRAQLWLYRHRTACRVMAVLGLLAAGTEGALRLASDGVLAGLASLAAGGGFASMLVSVHAVKRHVEGRGKRPAVPER